MSSSVVSKSKETATRCYLGCRANTLHPRICHDEVKLKVNANGGAHVHLWRTYSYVQLLFPGFRAHVTLLVCVVLYVYLHRSAGDMHNTYVEDCPYAL